MRESPLQTKATPGTLPLSETPLLNISESGCKIPWPVSVNDSYALDFCKLGRRIDGVLVLKLLG